MLVKYQVPTSHVQALPHVQSSIHFHPQWLASLPCTSTRTRHAPSTANIKPLHLFKSFQLIILKFSLLGRQIGC